MNDNTLLLELRQRCIHIENKLNTALAASSGCATASRGYSGHPDQVFGGATYAQHGDDVVALNIFHFLEIDKPSYLDIGAHHPVNISNTALLYQRGCRGINVDANPILLKAFETERPEDINLNLGVSDKKGMLTFYMIDDASGRNTFDLATAEAFVAGHPWCKIRKTIEVSVVTINEIIDTYANGVCPDYLSLDAEGFDARILKSLNFAKHRPKVICTEVVTGGGETSHATIAQSLTQSGYFSYFRTVGNFFFVDNSFRGLLLP
jgi:FkbM family methyltransferase